MAGATYGNAGSGGKGSKMITSKISNNDEYLTCPECGFEYVHLTKVDIYPVGTAKINVKIKRKGVSLLPNYKADDIRDVILEMTFFCEEGHFFKHRLHFHKGLALLATFLDLYVERNK